MRRFQGVIHAASRATLWLYAHFTLEWFFHVTKPSTLSVSALPARLMLLFAGPVVAWLFVAPATALLAAIDTRRREGPKWMAAAVPGLITATLALVACDNFARTVFHVGVNNASGVLSAVLFFGFVALTVITIRHEADRLTLPGRRTVQIAATLVAASLGTFALMEWREVGGPSRTETNPIRTELAPNILLIGIDGVDAEDLSPYGAAADGSPSIGRLAQRGTVFENAFSNAGRSYGSLISMLSGRLPTETHIIFPPRYLTGDSTVDHMPNLLRRRGYATAQIGMRHYADASDWNMRGGFDVINGRSQNASTRDVDDDLDLLRRHQTELWERVRARLFHVMQIQRMEDAPYLTSKGTRSPYFVDQMRLKLAREFLTSAREPWLLHVHLLDTHCCAGNREQLVRGADQSVDVLLRQLAPSQQAHTLIVLYSDHTRGWGTLGRIPLIIVDPSRRGGDRIPANVQLADVAPTILEAVGVDPPNWMSGVPLTAVPKLRPIYSLVDIAQVSESGPRMKVVQDSRPPFFGATSAAIILCDQYLKYSFTSQQLLVGRVPGHTAPCRDDLESEALRLLRDHLVRNGYPAPRFDRRQEALQADSGSKTVGSSGKQGEPD